MKLIPLPALSDNYIWMLHDGHTSLVVDPGDATPVLQALQERGLRLAEILVTHHHPDHVAGVDALRVATGAKVFGPARENVPQPCSPLGQGDCIDALGLSWNVIDVPGHTAGHIAYWCQGVDLDGVQNPVLFCGDTLFSGGCGRLFEGTPAQMLGSLDALASLPGASLVCCTHEYTLSNLRFALAVEPSNADLQTYEAHCIALRSSDLPTLPSNLSQELRINPFLRSRLASVAGSVRTHDASATDEVQVFAALREWKNQFK